MRCLATILLVEDRPDLGLYEYKLLERDGHRVIHANVDKFISTSTVVDAVESMLSAKDLPPEPKDDR